MQSRSRRKFLRCTLLGLPAVGITRRASAAVTTPSMTDGPFYPRKSMRFADEDNDLVRIGSRVATAGGEIVHLVGRIMDEAGAPVEAARVEIWQCDVNGRYIHTGDRGGKSRDSGFQGFGHSIADADGMYSFRTIKPVPYPGRTPHIHVKVLAGDRQLTTQFFTAGEPLNRTDSLYRRLSTEQRRAVEMQFNIVNDLPLARVDVVV